MHYVDLGESFPTNIYLQNLASIQPITSPFKFARSPRAQIPQVETATSVLQTKVEVGLQVSKARIAFTSSQNQTGRVLFYALRLRTRFIAKQQNSKNSKTAKQQNSENRP